MIDALNKVGEYSLSESKLDPENFEDCVVLLADNPKSSENYKKVLKIMINSDEKPFRYQGIDLEDISSSKMNSYLYRKGSGANGPDSTPTSRITEPEKTLKTKFFGWFKNINGDGVYSLNEEEKTFLKGLGSCVDENSEKITGDLKEKYTELEKGTGAIITLGIITGGKPHYIGDFSTFKKSLVNSAIQAYYSKHNKKSIEEDKTCFVCGNKREVYGFVSTYPFYTVNNIGMVSGGFDQSKSWKNYPVCLGCALTLEAGKTFLSRHSKFNFCGFDYFLIPKPLLEKDESEIYDIFRQFDDEEFKKFTLSKNYSNLLDATKTEVFEYLSEKENYFTVDLMIYEENNSAFNIIMLIEDIFPSRLGKLFEAKKKVEMIPFFSGKESVYDSNREFTGKRDLLFTFANIWHFFGKDNNQDTSSYFLRIAKKIFQNEALEAEILFSGFVRRIRAQYTNKKPLDETLMRSFQLLLFLNELKLLKGNYGVKMIDDVTIENLKKMNDKTDSEVADILFESFPDFFSDDIKKSVFLEGVLTQKLLNIQYRERGSDPFRSKLQGLKLDEKLIKRLLPQIENKLTEYKKNYYRDLEEKISVHMIGAGENWKIPKDEISYYFVLGMNLADLFKREKEEKSEDDEKNE
ncbi:CRISPR-associated protein Csh1 [Methanomicrobium sp. W14]|uniref:TIGR02556 family CRISPR-associated protein n=1 Tax=Methanomicrobium sp. W14 TaxID=2817839 RepID=UPI001AEAEBC2|nr:TIGR02556 family CRISPR-associated protein [Methanomicrobium sp. W14]MBP2133626.1 CRISPR-associated protein Csh1 [Methanomicrobium sp. W14]